MRAVINTTENRAGYNTDKANILTIIKKNDADDGTRETSTI